jgi:patatin-related protein
MVSFQEAVMSDFADPIQQEIRFSVVMYGGISLAIYINGVSQEIFKLVRATARKVRTTARKDYPSAGGPEGGEYLLSQGELSGSEKVYRKLGEHLNASFVVDILSGASAGGINAVFLAKALANDQPFEPLKKMWIEEGDINLLINDKKSFTGLDGLSFGAKPASLLNSQRMYYKLLEAMDRMEDPQRDDSFRSPYVGELDLFVTATDLHGLPLPLPIINQKILENRYRAIFRFHYSTMDSAGIDSNDFLLKENPFLAFAARCTSSFPVAFEPMCFSDTEPVLKQGKEFLQKYDYRPERWKKFYNDYAHSDFLSQPFCDGGCLDNKPFSYAIDTLSRRRADVPVVRKMLYIEPAPEKIQPEDESTPILRPDAIENTILGGVALPRQQTIREDFRVIAERNQNIQQINELLRNLTPVTLEVLGQNREYWASAGPKWATQYLDYSIQYFGPSYAFYHQLRVSNTVKDYRDTLIRNLGLEENSAAAQRLSQAVEKDWPAQFYTRFKDGKRKPENDLLFRLDLEYRLRRIQFVQQMINQLLVGANAILEGKPPLNPIDELLTISSTRPDLKDEEQSRAFQAELARMKGPLNDAYNLLRASGRSLRTRYIVGGEVDEKRSVPEAYIAGVRTLGDLLKQAGATNEQICQAIEDISLTLFPAGRDNTGILADAYLKASIRCKTGFKKQVIPIETGPAELKQLLARRAAVEIAEYLYAHYEFYDMVTYPIMFGTPPGESSGVDIFRISPQDATSLIDEKTAKRKKLLGTKFASFGAFFSDSWRENDMLWGRLDGAECLINALLPEDSPQKAQWLLEAQDAILRDDFLPRLKQLAAKNEVIPEAGVIDGQSALVQKFCATQVDGTYPPRQIATLAVRAAPVVGLLLRGMEDHRQYLRLIAVLAPLAVRAYSATLRIRDWLHLPWRLRGSAAGGG